MGQKSRKGKKNQESSKNMSYIPAQDGNPVQYPHWIQTSQTKESSVVQCEPSVVQCI